MKTLLWVLLLTTMGWGQDVSEPDMWLWAKPLWINVALKMHEAPVLLAQTPDQIPIAAAEQSAPTDVAAIQELRPWHKAGDLCEYDQTSLGMDCHYGVDTEHYVWTCADKSRVLLTSENGKHHCIKF